MTHRPIKGFLPILFCTILLDVVGLAMVFPVFPSLLTDPNSTGFLLSGYSKSIQFFIAGLATSLYGFMQFFASPIMGELSDMYGRKKLLLIGVATLAGSQLVFGFSVVAGSLWLLLLSRAIGGLAGGNFAIAQAMIADVTEPHERAKNFGLIGAAFGIGFILGPLLSGWIIALTHSLSAPFFLAALLGLVNVVFVSLILPETLRSRRNVKMTLWKGVHNIYAAFAHKDTQLLYSASFAVQLGFACFIAFVGVLLSNMYGFTEAMIGTFFAFVGVWIFIAQAGILRFVSRYSEKLVHKFSLPMVAVGIASYPFVGSGYAVYMIAPLGAVANPISTAMMISRISKSVSAERQGAALGINMSLFALAQGLAPLVGGLLSGFFGISAPFVLGGLFACVAWYLSQKAK